MALDVLVTVGMGPRPFDRLIRALEDVSRSHRVFAQIGTSRVKPPCPHAAFLPYDEFLRRVAHADVVVTHAGNTVRVVQRLGRVPVAVARRQSHGEMGNDHQVEYLEHEAATGRVVALDDVARLAEAVASHPEVERRILAERPPPPPVDGEALADRLDRLVGDLVDVGRRGRRPRPRITPS